MTAQAFPTMQLAVCINNTGYEAALELRKIYQVLEDPDATAMRYLRVIDESGEDYLYPASYFLSIELPPAIQRAILDAA